MYKLPMFKNYTVDVRLREFRRVSGQNGFNLVLERIDFDSAKGDKMVCQYIKTMDAKSAEFQALAEAII